MTDRSVVEAFLGAVAAGDSKNALACAAENATLEVLPLRLKGSLSKEGADFIERLHRAFPDLRLKVRRLFVGDGGVGIAEANLEGTQAAPFYGIINQEKHIDLDHAWRFEIAQGKIVGCRVFWCQNMLYRRLAVKRLDKVTITA
jgi:ketosteroid isomerase-like protein